MNVPPLDSAIQRYRNALSHLIDAIQDTKPPKSLLPCVLEVMAARDEIHHLLQDSKSATGKILLAIAELDRQLKNHAGMIESCLKSVDWQASFTPHEKAWWWSLKSEKRNPWWNQDWLWQGISITCLTISLGLFGDVSSRFLKNGPDTFGAIAVSTQSVLTLLTAGGALTIAGQEANKRLLKRLNVPEQYWHELGTGFSVLLLLGAVGLRQSLPQIASLYSEWGLKNYNHGDWGSAEEDYKRALQLNPDNDQTSFRLGLLYEELQDPEKARSNYQLAASAGIPEAINNLSRLSLLDKKPAIATPLLLKALEKEDQLSAETHYALLKNLGWARFLQTDYAEAESYLQEAIALQSTENLDQKVSDPNKTTTIAIASPYCLLAEVKEAQKDKQAALSAWETCNANTNPYISEENAWAVTARKKLKEQDNKK